MSPRRIATGLLSLLATLLLASLLVFVALSVLPGHPAAILLGIDADPAAVAALRAEMGLDRPLPVQFADWLGGVLTGDFGTSATYAVPVSALLLERAAVSVPLAALALLLSVGLALPAAVVAATHRDGAVDRAVRLIAAVGLAVPNVWLGLMLIFLFAVALGLAPAGGFPGWADPAAALGALVLPAVALGLPQAAILARVARAAIVEAMDEDYVALARAKGLPLGAAVRLHALPNAWPPILTIIGLQFGFLVAGAAVIETVFSLPGLGRLLFQAVAQRDLVVVQGVVLVLVVTVVVVNAAADGLAAVTGRRAGAAQA
jgi:peptide/nickel transport system permease protein